ncbi:uncharacterized [Tachysurus ichikawai]
MEMKGLVQMQTCCPLPAESQTGGADLTLLCRHGVRGLIVPVPPASWRRTSAMPAMSIDQSSFSVFCSKSKPSYSNLSDVRL